MSSVVVREKAIRLLKSLIIELVAPPLTRQTWLEASVRKASIYLNITSHHDGFVVFLQDFNRLESNSKSGHGGLAVGEQDQFRASNATA